MEVMIAMGIFAIGMIAIASIFPAATLLQRETMDDVLAQQSLRNATAILNSKPLNHDELEAIALETYAASNGMDVQTKPLYSLRDRSNADGMHWVPLVRRMKTISGPEDWQVFLFILRDSDSVDSIQIDSYNTRQFFFDNDYWPDGVADLVRAGDQILDNNGAIHTVTHATANSVTVSGLIFSNPNTPTRIWYGKPATKERSSPTRRITTLTEVVR